MLLSPLIFRCRGKPSDLRTSLRVPADYVGDTTTRLVAHNQRSILPRPWGWPGGRCPSARSISTVPYWWPQRSENSRRQGPSTGRPPASTPASTGTATPRPRMPGDHHHAVHRNRPGRSPPAKAAEAEPSNSAHQPHPESTTVGRPASGGVGHHGVRAQGLAGFPLRPGQERMMITDAIARQIPTSEVAGGSAPMISVRIDSKPT